MRRNLLTSDTTIAAAFSPKTANAVRGFVDMLTGALNRRVCAICHESPSAGKADQRQAADPADPWQVSLRQLARADKISLLVSDWPQYDSHLQGRLRLADEFGVPAIFIRRPAPSVVERVVVATAGGPNVLELMWVAREIACAHRVPVSILHFPDGEPDSLSIERIASRMVGLNAVLTVSPDRQFTRGIVAHLKQTDLLIMGAPSPLRRALPFHESIPDQVAGTVNTPIILLSSPPPNVVSLRRLFWGGLIRTGEKYGDKTEALSCLIGNLASHNQLPRSSQTDILDRALRREAVMSTAVDCETAFPVVTLRGFFGMAATMAVCPKGVDFGAADGLPTRFLYLTITPDGLCEDYLPNLSRIARRMIRPEIRKALLDCETPAQVLDILEPREPAPACPEIAQ